MTLQLRSMASQEAFTTKERMISANVGGEGGKACRELPAGRRDRLSETRQCNRDPDASPSGGQKRLT